MLNLVYFYSFTEALSLFMAACVYVYFSRLLCSQIMLITRLWQEWAKEGKQYFFTFMCKMDIYVCFSYAGLIKQAFKPQDNIDNSR